MSPASGWTGQGRLFHRPSGNYQNSASGFSWKKVRILFKTDSKVVKLAAYTENSSDAFRPAVAGRGEAPEKLSGFAAFGACPVVNAKRSTSGTILSFSMS